MLPPGWVYLGQKGSSLSFVVESCNIPSKQQYSLYMEQKKVFQRCFENNFIEIPKNFTCIKCTKNNTNKIYFFSLKNIFISLHCLWNKFLYNLSRRNYRNVIFIWKYKYFLISFIVPHELALT